MKTIARDMVTPTPQNDNLPTSERFFELAVCLAENLGRSLAYLAVHDGEAAPIIIQTLERSFEEEVRILTSSPIA
jgi:hypothetical protein